MVRDRRSVLIGLGGAAGALVAARPALLRMEGAPVPARVRPDLYLCEGCEAVAERPAASIPSAIRLASAADPGEALLLTGRVLTADGARAAPGVVIYLHQTNAAGLYANGSRESEWSRRHGRLRGWVRSDAEGRYRVLTIKPAPYPSRTMPAHIHLFVGEPGRRPYYIDDVVFDGEFLVDARYRARQELRGGSGIVRLQRGGGGVLVARRNIRLEPHPA